MLPFLQPRKMAGIMVAARKPSGKVEVVREEEDGHQEALMVAAEDLISAVNMKDAGRVADALQAAYDCCQANEDYNAERFGPPSEG